MKPVYLTFGLITTFCGGAMASDLGYSANGIAAHNIMAMQHTIMNRAVVLPTHAHAVSASQESAKDDDANDAYGEMIYYGEYGDDTGILPLVGRNGGDSAGMYIGADWQHIDENVKFKSYPHMDATIDLGMIEFSDKYDTPHHRIMGFKFFGGYVGGDIKNNEVRIKQNGGFVGALAHQNIGNLNVNAVANFGLMTNDVRHLPTADNFTNIWFALNMDVAYDFVIADVATLRPNVRGGYMWIFSPNYEAGNGEDINNKNFNMFELTPAIDLEISVGNGWNIGARGAYVMNFVHGGRTYVDYTPISKLETKDYFEYGIKITKSIGDLDFGLNAGRHDGGRRGWFGGVNIKYLF